MKAFNHPDPDLGLRNAKHLAGSLERTYPGAANSLREGLDEMFTVGRLGIDGRLAKTLVTFNPVESMISIARTTNRSVTRWRDGQMVLLLPRTRTLDCPASQIPRSTQPQSVHGFRLSQR